MKYVRNLIPLGTLGLAMYFLFADGVAFGATAAPSPPNPSGGAGKLVPVAGKKIWDLARTGDPRISRLELTDLIRFKDYWYCGFHEGKIHHNHPYGRARIIRSPDGENWESVALLTWDGGDVREPRFAITAEGNLMVYTCVGFLFRARRLVSATGDWLGPERAWSLGKSESLLDDPPVSVGAKEPSAQGKDAQRPRVRQSAAELPQLPSLTELESTVVRQSVTWLSSDGVNWGQAYACPTGVNTWRWDVTWHNGMGYSIGYSGSDLAGTLYRTRDGKSWRPLLGKFFPQGLGNEASLAFDDDDTAYCILRDAPGSQMFGVGKAPFYQEWTWKDTRIDWEGNGELRPAREFLRPLGGPSLLRLRDGRFVLAGRAGGISLFWVDPKNAILTRFASVAASTYAGIAEHEGSIWVTCGEGAAATIYLAKVPIPAPAGPRG
jgi:hypothetical protein